MPSGSPSLADHLPEDASADALLFAFLEWAEGRGLELYPHQEEAILIGHDRAVDSLALKLLASVGSLTLGAPTGGALGS